MMSLKSLSAGTGYQYLQSQVAVGDQALTKDAVTAYYAAEGEKPGIWMGSGIEALGVAGAVREDQLQAMYGEGLHPEANVMVAERVAGGMSRGDAVKDVRLGAAYRTGKDRPYTKAFNAEMKAFRVTTGRGATAGELKTIQVAAATKVLAVTDPVAARSPAAVAEFLGEERRRETQGVAGFDMTFSPAKSISTMWALGSPEVRAVIEGAQWDAVRQTIGFLEREVVFTRTGRNGVCQVETRGLVVTAFEHRTSRSNDPDLHIHAVAANRVQGPDGRWRTLDGRMLYAANVTASEMYNARLEDLLTERLGVSFVEVARPDGKRGVREIDGVDPLVNAAFSRRRSAIEARYEELLLAYKAEHHRDPSFGAQTALSQQATLETRDNKDAHRSLAELAPWWRQRAEGVLGVGGIDVMMTDVRDRGLALQHDARSLDQVAGDVVAVVSSERSKWKVWHVRAEVERQLRGFPTTDRDALVDRVTVAVLAPGSSVKLTMDAGDALPPELQRTNGESVFRMHGQELFSSEAVLNAELDLVAAGHARSPWRAMPTAAALAELGDGQAALVRSFTETGMRLAVAVGPAGTGKTTAMRQVVTVWEDAGLEVLALAPSAQAASELGEAIGTPAGTIARLLTRHEHGLVTDSEIPRGTMLLVDEAGKASTSDLDRLRVLADEYDAVLRLVGDPQQAQAVGAGGALGLLARELPCVELDRVYRFADPGEAAAGLLLRAGDPAAVQFYADRDRLHGGTTVEVVDRAYRGWRADRDAGHSTIMVAATNAMVADLNARARADLVAAGAVTEAGQVELRGEVFAGVGDVVLSRRNDSKIVVGGRGNSVRNGQLWAVEAIREDGSLDVRDVTNALTTTLPAEYVTQHVELGYACTGNRAQGVTVYSGHTIGERGMARQDLYPAMTRGTEANHFYASVEDHMGLDVERAPDPRTDVALVFSSIVARDGAELSATETMREEMDAPDRLDMLVPQYLHSVELLSPSVDHEAVLAETFTDAEVAEILSDPAAEALKSEMDRHGPAAGAAVAGVVAARELGTADSTAQVVQWRLEKVRPAAGDGPLPWLPPVPDVTVGSAALKDWTVTRGQEITDRAAALADRVDTERPAWAAVLPERPVEPERALVWDRAAGLAAAYREEFAVTGDAVLGDAPEHPGRQLDAYRAADTAVKATAPERPLKDLTGWELQHLGSTWATQNRMTQRSADRAREYITTNTEKVAAKQGPLVQAAAAAAAKDAAGDAAAREAEVAAARAAANRVIAAKEQELADAKGMFAGKRRQELGRDIDALTTARDQVRPRPAAVGDPEVMDRAHAADVEALAAKQASLTRYAETIEAAEQATEMVRAEESARADEQARETPAELAQERMEHDRAMEMVEVVVDHGIDI